MVDHTIDVLPRYSHIMDLAQTGIDRVFLKGSEGRDIADVILTETQTTLQYKRQRKNRGIRM